ncbi:uncharacterized protein LOC123980900 [Micropterus dolomieu]|uniref:uncharacterized protein LOC123980900 n=1 Tax=Micropterus dolomieu TaxID=147949 RepID=UPI001E8D0A1E|nr:uncharacterized protein LOC123980900 [Micropterus dolomieu]
MIYWMKRNKGGSGIPDSVSIMSKSEILREIVTEKLTTAAQEIFAVVERTVAGYEEEASGLRQEIDRQRRQLEAVLQPRVKLQRREDLIPRQEGHEAVVRLEEEEEEQTQQSDVEVSVSPGPWDDDDDDDDDEEGDGGEEEQQLSAPPATSPRREDLKDPDHQMKPRSISPTAWSDRKRASRPQISDTQSHIDLKIRILEDSQINVLSTSGLYKLPVQELQCPRGLQETDFLDLLRSTFPQLADQKQFDFCTFGRSRTPQPLRVNTQTPEEIYKRLIDARKTYLFIRLKTEEDPQSSSEDRHPVEKRDDSPSSFASTSADQTQMNPRSIFPRGQSERPSKPQISDTQSHIDLKIRLLEDSKENVLSKTGLYKLPIQEMQCPRGLQEADFLDLLRSTLPQLADQKQFDFCTFGRRRRLQPLTVNTLTPEEIYKRLIDARKTYLFIRLKTKKDPQSSSEDPVDDSPSSSASTLADQTQMNPR